MFYPFLLKAVIIRMQHNQGGRVQRLKVLTELYRFVTEITNDCLWEWNLQAKDIFWIDGGHKRVFGYQVENALIPQNFWESCIHPDDKGRVLKGVHDIITKGSSPLWEDKYRFKAANGSYHFVHDRAHIVYDEDGKAIRMIGATADITENVLLEKKLVQARLNRQREITDAVFIAQEKERATIGTELNENLNQLLVAAKWNIEIAKNNEDQKDICLKNSSDYLDKVIGEIKRIYKAIVIPDIRAINLFDNIKNLIHDINQEQPVKFCFYEDGIDLEEDLDRNLQLDIFRMVQEQLNNIIAHANATHATIKLIREGNKIILLISDNGQGSIKSTKKKGVGIINIISRAELYNGFVSIISKPGEGYTLKVVLPCS
jgi:PAS domain S-box-containing protein